MKKKLLILLAPLATLALLPGSANTQIQKIKLPDDYCNKGLNHAMWMDCRRQQGMIEQKLNYLMFQIETNQVRIKSNSIMDNERRIRRCDPKTSKWC